MNKNNRYFLLGSLRGIALISMILYHTVWDMVYIFGCDFSWFYGVRGYLWQQSVCFSFILISGICSAIGKKKLFGAIKVLLCSVLITAVTVIFMPQNIILFGILSLIGSSMLLMIPLKKVLKNINPWLGLLISVFLFILTKNLSSGYIEALGFKLVQLPKGWYSNLFTAYLGFAPDGFISYDYFPIIPWVFLYISGYFIYHILKRRRILKILYKPRIKPLEYIGRHSLIIYMLHQPVVYTILYIIFSINFH